MKLHPDQVKFRELYEKTRSVKKSTDGVKRPVRWGYRQMGKPYMADLLTDKIIRSHIPAIAIKEKKPEIVKREVEEVVLELDSPELIKKQWEDIILGRRKYFETITDKEGNEFTIEKEFPPAVIAKCLDMYAKALGMFIEKIDIKSEHTEKRTIVVVPEMAQALPKQVEVYETCTQCGEMVEEKTLPEHEKTCPGA